VFLFREGMSAESMVESYPALTLEEVHGALAFYLRNQKEIDAYLLEGQRAAQAQHEQSRQTNSELIAKLRRARHASQIPGSRRSRRAHPRGLRRAAPEIDIWTAADAGLAGLKDSDVLRISANSGRVLVSQDRGTMPGHFVRYVSSAQSPGVILLREAIPIAVAIEELVPIWSASVAEERI
jgi:hypothetical protein